MTTDLKNLHDRMRIVVTGTCNTIGCNNCDLKWTENGVEKCSATELQSKIMDIEMKEHE